MAQALSFFGGPGMILMLQLEIVYSVHQQEALVGYSHFQVITVSLLYRNFSSIVILIKLKSEFWLYKLILASFQWLLHATLPTEVRHGKSNEPTIGRMLYCIVINGLLCTPIMMIQMSFFQLISGDLQGNLYQQDTIHL